MTARIDEACGEEKTLKDTGLRSETTRRKMESFLRAVLGMREYGSLGVRRGFSLSGKQTNSLHTWMVAGRCV